MNRWINGWALVSILLVLAGCSGGPGEFAGVEQRQEGGFSGDSPSQGSVSDDGVSASLREDPARSPVSLTNSAFTIPPDASYLVFDYDLSVPPGNEDYLCCYLGERSHPLSRVGGQPGTYAATQRLDVVALRGRQVPLIFNLQSGWGDRDSSSQVTVRYLRFE